MTTARRLFFALWPGPDALVAATAAVHLLVPPGTGRPQRPDQLHLTLEFLGGVPEARLGSVLEVGEAVCRFGNPVRDRPRPARALAAAAGPLPDGECRSRAARGARPVAALGSVRPRLRPGAAPVQAAPDAGPQGAAATAGRVGRASALVGARVSRWSSRSPARRGRATSGFRPGRCAPERVAQGAGSRHEPAPREITDLHEFIALRRRDPCGIMRAIPESNL